MALLLLSTINRGAIRQSAALVATSPWTLLLRPRGGFDRRPVVPPNSKARQLSSAAMVETADALHNDTDDSSPATLEEDPTPPAPEPLLDPKELCPVLEPPAALSPSSIAEFLACPQSFLFQYLYKLKQPTSLALLKGRLCHSALEQLYDLSPIDRNVTNLHNLFRKNYKEQRDENLHLFRQDNDGGMDPSSSSSSSVDERTWGMQSLQLLTNYMNTEDATSIEPAKREVWVSALLPRIDIDDDVDEDDESRSWTASDPSFAAPVAASLPKNRTFLVRGIVDRLDLARGYDSGPNRVHCEDDNGELEDDRVDPTVLGIVDYKTSQQPNLKYSPAMNRKIQEQSFFQLQIYALLLHERQMAKQQERLDRLRSENDNDGGDGRTNEDAAAERAFYLPVRFLKLLYLKSDHNRHADCWTLDLGSTPRIRKRTLDATKQKLQHVYRDIAALVSTQDPKAFVGCNRSFCYCHVCRPRFAPGTVWEPPTNT